MHFNRVRSIPSPTCVTPELELFIFDQVPDFFACLLKYNKGDCFRYQVAKVILSKLLDKTQHSQNQSTKWEQGLVSQKSW